MSGGQLVVLDRNGRDVKRYPLPSGLATLGSDPACDIRVMLSSVSAHHATVVVHSNQTLVRNVSGGDTLVNGEPVSVAALSHGDVISLGGRSLRWEYTEPTTARHQKTEPALAVWRRGARRGGRLSAAAAAAPAALAREPALRLALEMSQRASMPGSSGGKQVAIVQPQRRDTKEQDDKGSSRSPAPAGKRPRASKSERDSSAEADGDASKRKSALQSTTKATLWIESRKSSPKSALAQARSRRSTPLRLAVLKRHRPRRPPKIQAPLLLDQTKRAAILLMAGHTPRSRLLAHTPSAPGAGPHAVRERASWAGPSAAPLVPPRRSPRTSPPLGGARKSALKDPAAKRRARKADSIKFDLSNLEDGPREADAPAPGPAPAPRRSGRGGRQSAGSMSPASGRSGRASLLLRRALDASEASPAVAAGLEAYSIVDLVSVDSDDSMRSAYGSAGSEASAAFGTPSSAPPGGGRRLPCSTPRVDSQSTPENSEDALKQVTLTDVRKSRGSRSRSRIDDSDLVFVDDDDADDSPRSSRRGGASAAGTLTPENASGPAEASTPVLSIQSLLDSSRSSVASRGSLRRSRRSTPSFPTKRRTVGSLASDRSVSFAARKTRLRLSSDSVEEADATLDADADAATPRSAAKPAPEAVKNKHSTAKKPRSKRSIIDDLNESDVVKQLFNSPVKRKLSQSMTELSRKRVFADEEAEARRPARNTFAGSTRTPEDSLPDRSDAFTPERFVSPVGSPGRSPELAGLKRMLGRAEPRDDLTDVRGVRGLLRTPRARRSARNDLSDVAGVKALFARSPANRLSDVRVKQVFAAPPADDLRRVTGLPSLFKRRSRRSPANDLTDVRGVKLLFARTSPRSDLRNVSGVKRTMRRNSPRNDYTDVRGVRRMFGRGDRKETSSGDLSGVGDLFNTSNLSHKDSESLFDQLIGKPTIKAVYSKTFVAKGTPKAKRQSRKSLAASLDLITDNVEQWLERELQKRLCKKDEGRTADKSNRNLTRELQKLATDTVEGNTPLRNSRIRIGSASRSGDAGRKKSASDIYGAHTLPIKKRSLAEASVEKPLLPLKKRAVVHSTPVKGRLHLTMNASELGRVSPIAALDKTTAAEHDTSVRLTQQSVEAVKPRGQRRTKLADDGRMPPPPQSKAPSPRKTRGRAKMTSPSKAKRVSPAKADPSPAKTREISPGKPRATRRAKVTSPRTTRPQQTKAEAARSTRARRNLTPAESNVKKRRASIVVAKKSPAMSPKPPATRNKRRAKATPEPAKAEAPKPTRKTRGTRVDTTEEKGKSPKNTRTKARKVAGEAPTPQAKSKGTLKVQLQEPNKPKRGRAAKVKSPKESPVETGRKTRGNDTQSVSTARGRKTVEKQDSKDGAPATTRRGRKTAAAESTDGVQTLKADVAPKETKARGRSGKLHAQESERAEPPSRGRRAAQQDPAPSNTRKRKAPAVEEVPSKVAKATAGGRGRGRKAADEAVAPGRPARAAGEPPAAPRTRGAKIADVSKSVSVAGKRKRKKSVEPSPVKGGRARRR